MKEKRSGESVRSELNARASSYPAIRENAWNGEYVGNSTGIGLRNESAEISSNIRERRKSRCRISLIHNGWGKPSRCDGQIPFVVDFDLVCFSKSRNGIREFCGIQRIQRFLGESTPGNTGMYSLHHSTSDTSLLPHDTPGIRYGERVVRYRVVAGRYHDQFQRFGEIDDVCHSFRITSTGRIPRSREKSDRAEYGQNGNNDH